MTTPTSELRSRAKEWLLEARRLRAEAKTGESGNLVSQQLLGQSDACRFLARITLAHLKKPLEADL